MRLFLLIFALGLMITGQVLAVEKPKLRGIKGADDRTLIEKYDYPWSAIGRLNKEVGGFCTATLIAPKLALTAAHCLWNKKRKVWLKPHTIHFLAGYRRGSYIDHSVASKFHISPQYDPNKGNKLSVASKDWAILELKKDISPMVGTFDITAMDEVLFKGMQAQHIDFTQAGYSQDKSHILSINKICKMKGYQAKYNVVVHGCDAVHGDSGSPIFYLRDGVPTITSIHVATTSKGTSEGIAVSGGSIAQHLKKIGLWDQVVALKPHKS